MANSEQAFEFPCAEDLTKYIFKVRDQCLAAGSFGDVHECRYERNLIRKRVAVKAFRFKIQMDDKSGMARRELGIWRRLDHPSIVPFLGTTTGFGVTGSVSLVSLWMPNGTLQSFLQKHEHLEVEDRLKLLLDVANGLNYLHSFSVHTTAAAFRPYPIIHGDLSPANVLLDENYNARLIDFGYASMLGGIPDGFKYLQRCTNRPGALRWNAPEQVRSTESDVRRTPQNDVYSFGCIARQVLSGEQPWSEFGEDVAVVLRLSRGETPGQPKSRPIADRYWQLIERCFSPMEKRPPANLIVCYIEQFLSDFPGSRSLREVITPLNSQQANSSGSSSSTPAVKSGDGVPNGVVSPESRDLHIVGGTRYSRQSQLSELTGVYYDAPQSLSPALSESTTGMQSEGSISFPAPAQGHLRPWLFRKPRE